jgi:hypothetical protein
MQLKRVLVLITAIILVAWLLVSVYLSLKNQININIQASAPILIGVVLLIASPAFKHIADHLPADELIRLHGLRLSSLGYVLMGLADVVPLAFGLMAGIGDMLIGASALFVSSRYAHNPTHARRLAIAWSVLGILDIAIGRALGTMLNVKLPTGITISPTFSVPLVILVHILILRALLRKPSLVTEAAAKTPRTAQPSQL